MSSIETIIINSRGEWWFEALVLTVAFFVAIALTTTVIRLGLSKLAPAEKTPAETESRNTTGFWIGFCETLMIFIFVTAREYGALAIIIGAKEFVRKEKINENASYYLLGTLVNLTVAILIARLAMRILAY